MPYWWWIFPALAGVLALSVVAGAVVALLGRHPWRALGSALSGIALLALAAAALMLGLDIQTYRRLAYERPIATIDLKQTGDKSFDAIMVTAPTGQETIADPPRTYALTGDEWRVEAQVLKWKPWANALGLDSLYRLERVAGEYTDTTAEQTAPHSVYDLRPSTGAEPYDWRRLQHAGARLTRANLVDTLYGSAALMPMADGARYELSMTQSGLVARPANDAALKAVGQGQ